MATKDRPVRASGKAIKGALGTKAQADSQSAGSGSENTWVNERGEICIGNKCFTLAINPNAQEVTVRVDRNECGADMQPIVDSIFEVIGRGGRTLYESTSIIKK